MLIKEKKKRNSRQRQAKSEISEATLPPFVVCFDQEPNLWTSNEGKIDKKRKDERHQCLARRVADPFHSVQISVHHSHQN